MNLIQETTVVEKKKKNGKTSKNEGTFETPPVASFVDHPVDSSKDIKVSQERYIEYLEGRIRELEWSIARDRMESTTQREKSQLSRFHYFLRKIQNAPLDSKARSIVDRIWKEEIVGEIK